MSQNMQQMNYSETVAKRVIEAVLPGARLTFKPQQSDGEYDFDLLYPDGTSAAVEVTASVNQQLASTVAAIRGNRAGGSTFPTIKCSKSWIIFPASGANIPEVRRRADVLLSQLEQAGIESFSLTDRAMWGHPICKELHLTSGAAFDETTPAIYIGFPITGGAVSVATAIGSAGVELSKEDNKRKLGRAKTDERHLAVYVDAMNGSLFSALLDFDPPPDLPDLPEEISHIWIIGQLSDTCFVLWRAESHRVWQKAILNL